jgi:uncharacterized protein YjdB
MESLLRPITISFAASAILCLAGTGCEARRVTEAEAEITASVSVTPPSATVIVQGSLPLSAVAKNVAGVILPGRPITWSSNNPSVATVSSDGNVTGVGIGVTTVVATSDGQSGTSTISVTPVSVSSVEVLPPTARVAIGDSLRLAAIPKDASNAPLPGRAMSWSSSHTSIARVTAAGLVTAVAAGVAYIVVTTEGKSDTATIDVVVPPVASVTVAPSTASVVEGQTVQLTATTRDAKGVELTDRVVTWVSSNPSRATVSSSGTVLGILEGSATITATAEGSSASAAVTVTAAPPLVVDAGGDQAISLGASASLKATVTSRGPGPVNMFWTKIAGPGVVRFAHEHEMISHETGDYSEWLKPDQFGFVKGAYEGGATMTTERAYSGRWSWKGINDPNLAPPFNYSAKVSRWAYDGITAPGQAHYMSAWYWWPEEYDVPQGASNPPLIMQWKARTSNNPVMPIFGKHHWATGVDIINIYDWTDNIVHDNPAAVIPKGRWFNITAYLLAHQTAGVVIVWLDGVKMYHLTGENTLDAASNTMLRLYMGIANYANNHATIDHPLWVDDFSITAATADQLNTSASFSEPGTYLLRLTASSSLTTLSDTIRVTVR